MTTSRGNFLPEDFVIPKDKVEFDIFLKSTLTSFSKLLNRKDTGTYDLVEQQINQQFFSTNPRVKRQVLRKAYNIGAIASGVTSTTAHGITGFTAFTRIYGTAVTATPTYIPLPYASVTALNQQVSLTVTATNIVIVNGAAAANITSAIVVLEYVKQN